MREMRRRCAAKYGLPFSGSVWRRIGAMRLVDRGGSKPKMLPEHAAEVRRAGKAPRKCDIRDGLAVLGLQLLAAVQQPRPPDIIADGHALVAEQHVQIALGAAQRRRDLVDAKLRIAQMFADE